jgi:hypothetical protein
MTTPALREELQRIGQAAPVATVRPDTWSRARASRRRTIAAGVAGVVAVAGVATGLAVGLPSRDHSAPVVDTGPRGIPDKIVPLPSGVELEADLAVGQASVAFMTDDGIPVVIGAADGRYHPLDLPGATGDALALSPSGGLLAYTASTGIRVLDLTEGELRSDVDLGDSPFAGVVIQQLDWAPTSDALVFGGASDDQGVAGRVLVDSDDPFPGGEIKDDPQARWVSTEVGGFLGVGTGRMWFHDGQNDWKRKLSTAGTPVAIHAVTPAAVDLRRDGDGYRMYLHDATTDTELQLPSDFPTGDVSVDAWLPGSRVVLTEGERLLLVEYGESATLTRIGTDASGSDDLTIATDLMTD